MASAWQTLEEAALTLGISSRTLHRRLAKGDFETRMQHGRREVLVNLADPTASASTADIPTPPSVTSSANVPASTDEDDFDGPVADSMHPTVLALHEDRLRRTDLAIMAYQQSVNVAANNARRAQVQSRVAWSMAGVTVTALFVAAIWATHTVTRARAEVDTLSKAVRQLSDTADSKSREADTLRGGAESARVAAARAEGELTAVKTQVDQLKTEQQQIAARLEAAQAASAMAANAPANPPPNPSVAPVGPAATTQPVGQVAVHPTATAATQPVAPMGQTASAPLQP